MLGSDNSAITLKKPVKLKSLRQVRTYINFKKEDWKSFCKEKAKTFRKLALPKSTKKKARKLSGKKFAARHPDKFLKNAVKWNEILGNADRQWATRKLWSRVEVSSKTNAKTPRNTHIIFDNELIQNTKINSSLHTKQFTLHPNKNKKEKRAGIRKIKQLNLQK